VSVPSLQLALVAVVLVALAGAFAAAEASLSRLSRARAEELAEEGRRGAAALRLMAEDPAPHLNVSTFLRLAAEMGAAVAVTLVWAAVFDVWWQALAVATALMGVVSFVLVGVGPRTIGRQHADRVALLAAPGLRLLTRVLGPLARLLVLLGNAVTPGPGYRDGPFASEAELRELVDMAGDTDVIEAGERAMIHSVFELGDTIVRAVMVPRTDMVTIDAGTSLHSALTLFLRSGFSRVPVVGSSLDDVLGILYLKDVARLIHEEPASASRDGVESAMRPAVFVPESKPVDDLLREMQRDSTHVAVVVDEFGGTAGLVTIEDLIEEIVGEIADEYDREAPGVERLDEGTYRISARLPIDELGELFDIEIDDEDVDSVGGLLSKALERVPIPGAQAQVAGLLLTAERLEGRRNRIATVLVRRADDGHGTRPERGRRDEHVPG
jgi:CBS domain containing-hemolysin-like protein